MTFFWRCTSMGFRTFEGSDSAVFGWFWAISGGWEPRLHVKLAILIVWVFLMIFFALIHLVCHRYTLYVIKIILKISSQNISSCECGGGGSFQMEQLCQLSLFIVSAPPFLSEMKNVSTRPFWNMFNHMSMFISYVIFITGLKWRMSQVLILSSISSGFGYGTRSVFSTSTNRGWKRISFNADRLLCL